MFQLNLDQKLVLTEKGTNAIYFVVVASNRNGIVRLEVKGIMNLNYLSKTSMSVYDMERFSRYYGWHDFYEYYEEKLVDKVVIDKRNNQEMNFEKLEEMMKKPYGHLMLRIGEKKKHLFTEKEYQEERLKYLSLMHLAVDLGDKSLYSDWCEAYKGVENKWQQKEAT